jgi:NADPH:quinone reductase-like Zn-dependent oxidoreductase
MGIEELRALMGHTNIRSKVNVGKLVDEGKLKAHVSTVLPRSEVKKALQLSKSGRTRGKIVLQIGTSF